MAVVLSSQEHTQVLLHQVSRRRSQSPFRRSHGQVQCVAFHPSRPFLLVASQRSIRIYHLLRQELTKKLMPNCKWVSSMAVHPAGEGSMDAPHQGRGVNPVQLVRITGAASGPR